MANKKYRGILTKDLTNGYGDKILKGQEVLVYKRRVYDDDNCWTGEWEYHYSKKGGKGLIRSDKLHINIDNQKKK